MSEKNTPVAKCKAVAVHATIWKNFIDVKGKKTAVLKVNVQKRYKAGLEWKTTTSFNRTEAFLAMHALQAAVTKMIEMENEKSTDTEDSNGTDSNSVEEEVMM